MTKKRGKAYVGTSYWTYSNWRGRFYPQQVPRRQWFQYYASQFASKEVNGSFYRTPSVETVMAWREQTPAHFRLSRKTSKFITHWKRPGPTAASSLKLMETRLAVRGRKSVSSASSPASRGGSWNSTGPAGKGGRTP